MQRGKTVHLSTTDPAAHLAGTVNGDLPGLKVSRIDPKVETQRYIDKIMAAKSPHLDAQEQALLMEDLQWPCTEKVAVFHAFSRIVSEGRKVTPVSHAAALQDDLRRAQIEPFAWVLNKSVLAAGTRDPLLQARLAGERKQIERMSAGLARRLYALPWLATPPIGLSELAALVRAPAPSATAAV